MYVDKVNNTPGIFIPYNIRPDSRINTILKSSKTLEESKYNEFVDNYLNKYDSIYTMEPGLEKNTLIADKEFKAEQLNTNIKEYFREVYGPSSKLAQFFLDSNLWVEIYKVKDILARFNIKPIQVIQFLSAIRTVRHINHIGTNKFIQVPDRLISYRFNLSRKLVACIVSILSRTPIITSIKIGKFGEFYIVLNEKLIANDSLFIIKHSLYEPVTRYYRKLLLTDDVRSLYYDPIRNDTKATNKTYELMSLTFSYNRFITPDIYTNNNRDQMYEHRQDIMYAHIPIRMLSSITGLSQNEILSHFIKVCRNCSWMKLHKKSYIDTEDGPAYYNSDYNERELEDAEKVSADNVERTVIDKYSLIIFKNKLNEARWFRRYKKRYKDFDDYVFRWIYFNVFLNETTLQDSIATKHIYVQIYKTLDMSKVVKEPDDSNKEYQEYKDTYETKQQNVDKYGRDESWSMSELNDDETGKLDLGRLHKNRYCSLEGAQKEDILINHKDSMQFIDPNSITTSRTNTRPLLRVKIDKLLSILKKENIKEILPTICSRINYIIKHRMGYDLNKEDKVRTSDITYYTKWIGIAYDKIKSLYNEYINILDVKNCIIDILSKYNLLNLI